MTAASAAASGAATANSVRYCDRDREKEGRPCNRGEPAWTWESGVRGSELEVVREENSRHCDRGA